MRKVLVVWLVLIALVAAACGGGGDDDDGVDAAEGPSGAQTYEVDVDAAGAPQLQFSTYFPGKITVRPGDTIQFTNKAQGYPHTVTLGIKADQSNRPPLITDKGENPAAFGPCFTDTEPSTQLTSCPTQSNPASPPEFTGKGYWNSGVIANGAGPNTPNKVTLKLADSITPGDYSYACMLHPFMAGVMTVAASDGDRLSPTAVRASAESASASAVKAGGELKPPAATPGTVTAGYGDRIVAVNLFDPKAASVKVGDTVTWKSVSPYEPHTVTFESKITSPGDPAAAAPAGVKSGGTYTGGFTNSGFIGPPPFFPSNNFALKFTKAGTYEYVCILHPSMTGAVTVT